MRASMMAETSENIHARLQDFFEGLAHTHRLARAAQARLDLHLATGFSVFNFYRPDENGFSDILKDLLDPNGSHGQGCRFLEAFVEGLGNARLPRDSKLRSIAREQLASWAGRARRIDLCLVFDRPSDQVLAIENKHWAADQDEQIVDYIACLDARHRDRWTFVYLSPAGRDPPSLNPEHCRELKATKRLIPLSYCSGGDETGMSIERWCERCIEVAEAERVRSFLRDLLAFVRASFPVLEENAA
jgi:PD-(D/E)XK nuclease superfamily